MSAKKKPAGTIDPKRKIEPGSTTRKARPRAEDGHKKTNGELSAEIDRALSELYERAMGGDAEAFEIYFETTCAVCLDLVGLSGFHWKTVDRIARKRVTWPVLFSLHPDSIIRNLVRLREMGLGAEVPIRVPALGSDLKIHRRYWSQNSLPNALVLAELGFLPPKTRRTLPPLSGQSLGPWFTALWENILARHAGTPERDLVYRSIGKHKVHHSVHRGRQKQTTFKTGEADIRSGIRECLRLAFMRIFKSTP